MDSYNNKTGSGYDEFEDEAGSKDGGASASGGKFSKEKIIASLKQPKNLFILIGTVVFLIVLVLKFSSGGKKNETQKVNVEDPNSSDKIPQIANLQEFQNPTPQVQVSGNVPTAIAPPSLPTLDINLFKGLDSKVDDAKAKPEFDDEDAVNSIDLAKLRKELEDSQKEDTISFDDFDTSKKVNINEKIRKRDPEKPVPPIFEASGANFVDRTKKRPVSDFIFIDSSLDAEISTDVPNEGKKISDLGNVIAQGRIMDAILESAIDSSIPGTIRAIISKDVFAEVGRSVLIPKGTRLYGSYSAGGGRTGRMIITWSRIIRPDGISVGIDSFASDQFGRAGIEGDVDKKYGEVIASALLLSTIPLVATIATQQVTGGRREDVSVTNTSGIITTQSDPVNRATERFSNDIAKATEQVVKNLIDTTIVVKVAHGTRIKVMVNQDLKLPRYKALTSLNTTVTNSSQ